MKEGNTKKMSAPKLYYTTTSCGAANYIAATLGGITFDSEKVDLRTGKTESGGDFEAINWKGNVPALVLHDGSEAPIATTLGP